MCIVPHFYGFSIINLRKCEIDKLHYSIIDDQYIEIIDNDDINDIIENHRDI